MKEKIRKFLFPTYEEQKEMLEKKIELAKLKDELRTYEVKGKENKKLRINIDEEDPFGVRVWNNEK